MASGAYKAARLDLATGALDWTSADIRATILGAGYTFDDTDAFLADVTSEELSSSYRTAVTGRTATDNTGASPKRKEYDAADTEFAGPTGTGRYVVYYVHNASTSSAQLVYCADLGSNVTLDGRDWSAVVGGSGLFSRDFVTEDFNGADATSLGGAWTDVQGSIGRNTNQGYIGVAGAGYTISRQEASTAEVRVQFTVKVHATEEAIIFRLQDASNHWSATNFSGNLTLFKRVAGTYSSVASGAHTTAANDVLVLVTQGDSIRFLANGTIKASANSQTHTNTATKHGIGLSGATARVDDFRLDTIWNSYAITGAFAPQTAIASAESPEADAIYSHWLDLIALTWTPVDNGTDPIDETTATLEANGVTLAVDTDALAAGAWRVSGFFPFPEYEEVAVTATIETDLGTLNIYTWTFSTGGASEGWGLADLTVTSGTESHAVVEFTVAPLGWEYASSALVEFIVRPGIGWDQYTPALVEMYVAKGYEEEFPLLAVIGEGYVEEYALALEIFGPTDEEAYALTLAIAAESTEEIYPAVVVVTDAREDEYAVTAVVGEADSTAFPITAVADAPAAEALVQAFLRSEAMADQEDSV
jgi:hypothetical protein